MFVVLKGCAIIPLDRLVDSTSEPSTWYNKISVKSGEASKSAAVIFIAVNVAVNAASVGANTVNSAKGFVSAGNNRASITAATNVLWSGLSIAISATVSPGSITPFNTCTAPFPA